MVVVYTAHHRLMKQTVTVKRLSMDVSTDDNLLTRFERKFKIATSLKHVNIVGALGTRAKQETHYLIMNYIDGCKLSAIINEQSPLPVRTVIKRRRSGRYGMRSCP